MKNLYLVITALTIFLTSLFTNTSKAQFVTIENTDSQYEFSISGIELYKYEDDYYPCIVRAACLYETTGGGKDTLFIINTINYFKTREHLELRLMILWLLQLFVMTAYYAYFLSEFKDALWEQGIWFTANDVLHVLLIFWMLYIIFFVVNRVEDIGTDT